MHLLGEWLEHLIFGEERVRDYNVLYSFILSKIC